jgi:hypothetical protein
MQMRGTLKMRVSETVGYEAGFFPAMPGFPRK